MKNKIIKPAVIFIILIVVCVLVIFAVKSRHKKNNVPAMTRDVKISESVTYGSITEIVSASGAVLLKEETDIYGEDDGYKVSKILVEEGDEVQAGQAVVQYDIDDTKTELENKIRDTKRSIENAELALKAIITPKTETEITKLKNAVTSAEKGVTDAQTTYDNYESKLASQQESINSAQLELDSIQLELDSAQIEADSAQSEIEAAQRNVDIAKTDLDTAQNDVDTNEKLLEIGGISQQEYDDSVTALNKQLNTYESAEETLEKAKSSLEKTNISLEKTNISLEKAKSSLEEAKRNYNDMLIEQENAKLSITTAQNSLTEARQSYADALKDPLSDEATKIKYQQQQLTLDGLKDNLEDYQKDYDDLVEFAISPVDGTVTNVAVDETSFIVDNTIMLTISNYNNLIVSANIEEYDAPLVDIGQSVAMTSDGLEGKVYTGKITKVSGSASSASTTAGSETVVPIEISVDNPDGILKPGYNLDLEITVKDLKDILVVSSSSIANDGKTGEKYVYKVNGNTISKTTVEAGESDDSYTQIISGLSENDKVIMSNTEKLSDGMSIEDIINMQISSETGNNASNNSNEGGLNNDRGQRNNQMLPSGGFGGGGPGGGGPMGR